MLLPFSKWTSYINVADKLWKAKCELKWAEAKLSGHREVHMERIVVYHCGWGQSEKGRLGAGGSHKNDV